MLYELCIKKQFLNDFFPIDNSECKQCPRVLTEIEHIDDDADNAGINFIKMDDKQMEKEFGIFALPAILFFKMGSKEPVIYAGKWTVNKNGLPARKCRFWFR